MKIVNPLRAARLLSGLVIASLFIVGLAVWFVLPVSSPSVLPDSLTCEEAYLGATLKVITRSGQFPDHGDQSNLRAWARTVEDRCMKSYLLRWADHFELEDGKRDEKRRMERTAKAVLVQELADRLPQPPKLEFDTTTDTYELADDDQWITSSPGELTLTDPLVSEDTVISIRMADAGEVMRVSPGPNGTALLSIGANMRVEDAAKGFVEYVNQMFRAPIVCGR